MVHLKPSMSETVQGGPKYGHLSKIDPAFVPLVKEIESMSAMLWALELQPFKDAWTSIPPSLPDDCPLPDVDIDITDSEAVARDGTKIPIRIYTSNKPPHNATLYLKSHGGGFVFGSHEMEEAENRFVAAIPNVVVVSVDYRLAPEFKFPIPVNDCFDALKWCKANAKLLDIDPEKIIVGGGSAGGNISAVLAQMARDEGVSGVIGQVLNIPATCHPKFFPTSEYEYCSYGQNKDAPVINQPMMDWFWEQYMPDPKPEVYASPILAKSLHGLPPALIQVCGMDPLRDEGLAYAEKLEAHGVKVIVKTYQGLPHGFVMFPQLKATGEYLQNVVAFVKNCAAGNNPE